MSTSDHEDVETEPLLPRRTTTSTLHPETILENEPYLDYISNTENVGSPTSRMLGVRKLLVVMSILVCELCERLTYYSVVANLVLYCTSVLKYTSNDAATILLVFQGIVYVVPVIGGYIADAVAGRYNTIYGAALIYLIGLVMLPASAVNYRQLFGKKNDGSIYDMSLGSRRGCFMGALVFIALGTGGIKANVGPFGAQQVQNLGEKAVKSFFNWFYWFINAGALVAYTWVAYLQQNVSWAWGFSVPFCSMLLAIFVFACSRGKYEHISPGDSVMTTVFKVYRAGCGDCARARKKNGGPFDDFTVDGALSVIRVMPVFLLMIFYWAIYSQMSSTFFIQAERMSVKVGKAMLPVAMLNIFDTIIILLLIPLVDRVIYPLFDLLGRPLTHLQRMGLGLILAACSVIVAGVIEIYRKKDIVANGAVLQTLGGEAFNASSMSVFVQVPEYALVGASEVFASITGLEFAFTQAPPSMQGLLTGLFMMTTGLGSFVASAILKIVDAATAADPWFPDEINNGKTENLFFLLGGLMFLDFIVFLFVARWYRYFKPPTEGEDTDPVERDEIHPVIYTADSVQTVDSQMIDDVVNIVPVDSTNV